MVVELSDYNTVLCWEEVTGLCILGKPPAPEYPTCSLIIIVFMVSIDHPSNIPHTFFEAEVMGKRLFSFIDQIAIIEGVIMHWS